MKLVGLGEGADDLAPFETEDFVDALLNEYAAKGRDFRPRWSAGSAAASSAASPVRTEGPACAGR